jgi:deoxyribodipyrimidine photo-lyase
MTATRAEGLRRLAAFAPRMGGDYALWRNHDTGAASVVSRLSAHLRHRLVTEAEVIGCALAAHGPHDAAKFVDEVIWRSYFKGWLELRPAVWRSYVAGVVTDAANLGTADRLLLDRVLQAQSGIACMDAWVQELTETGYLHNHARMWFASIWVFSLGLPWRLGADFFLRHLVDGDPASNTLGWRWVAGLHTPGKTYHAEASNIATFTRGRLTPDPAQIAQRHTGPVEVAGLPSTTPLRPIAAPDPALPSLLLITAEDGCPQDFPLAGLNLRGTVAMQCSHLRSPHAISAQVASFEAAALVDTLTRLGHADATICSAADPGLLAAQARAVQASQIVTPFVPTGALHDWLTLVAQPLRAQGLTLTEWRRPWDELIWPDCTAGFFKVKQKIPHYLHKSGLLAR